VSPDAADECDPDAEIVDAELGEAFPFRSVARNGSRDPPIGCAEGSVVGSFAAADPALERVAALRLEAVTPSFDHSG